jgi:hypothetical protein
MSFYQTMTDMTDYYLFPLYVRACAHARAHAIGTNKKQSVMCHICHEWPLHADRGGLS